MFYRYGFFSLSVRVVPRDDPGRWLIREPTANIFEPRSVVHNDVAGPDTFARQPIQVRFILRKKKNWYHFVSYENSSSTVNRGCYNLSKIRTYIRCRTFLIDVVTCGNNSLKIPLLNFGTVGLFRSCSMRQ